MKKTLILISSLLCLFSVQASNDYYLKHGDVNVTQFDLDGFSLTIPKKDRAGFFQSTTRVQNLLLTLLNKKLVASYGEGILDNEKIEKLYQQKVAKLYSNYKAKNIVEETRMIKVKSYIKINIVGDMVKESIIDNVNSDNNFTDFAKEQYLVDKDKYLNPKEIDYNYITILYDESNKSEKLKIAKDTINQLEKSAEKFQQIIKSYMNDDKIDMAGTIKSNVYVKGNVFLDKLFDAGLGLIKQPIVEEKRIFVVSVTMIKPDTYTEFDAVKNKIIAKLRLEVAEQRYNELLLELSAKNELIINKEAIVNIKKLYY